MTATEPEKQDAASGKMALRPLVLAAIVVAAIVVALLAITTGDPFGESGSGLSERFSLGAEPYQQVDPQLVGYQESAAFPVPLGKVRCIATGPANEIYVGGDRAILKFSAEGEQTGEISLSGAPSSLAVTGAEQDAPGRLYVALEQRIQVIAPGGSELATWTDGLNDESILTSIAVSEDGVFVADAGNRLVLRFNDQGEVTGQIGQIDPDRGIRGFVIPSPYFDVAVTDDGLLRVANPGARRIEAFSFDGDLLGHWGMASANVEGFFGCCNPCHFAVLPDGRFVTSEKGIPRDKVYSDQGEFDCVVADPQALGETVTAAQLSEDGDTAAVFDVAADRTGRVLVLDPTRRRVLVYVEKQS